MSDDQGELFNARRYSPVSVAVYVRLPESSARSFAIASALGRFMRRDGTFEPVRSVTDAGGVVVGPKQRPKILAALNIQPRRWRALISGWESRYVCHRCAHDTVCLFVQPLEAACPACRAPIRFASVPPAPDARRHESGTTTTTKAALVRPQSGSNTTAEAVPTRPLSVADSMHPKSGVLQGDEVGGWEEPELQELEERSEEELTGSRNRAAIAESESIQTAALVGDWREVERLAEILGWAKVAELSTRAGSDPDAADMVRAKLGIDLKTALWTTWWGALSEEVCISRAS